LRKEYPEGDPGHLSQVDGLFENSRTNAGFQSVLSGYIHFAPQELLQLANEGGMREKPATRLELDEQINVTIRPCIATGHRAEHTQIPGPVTRRQSQDLIPPLFQPR